MEKTDGLLTQVKKSMRISHVKLDDILLDDIKAGALDLKIAGVLPYVIVDEKEALKEDPLLYKTLELYCKWQEDFQGKGEMYEKSYKNLKDAMALCGDYNE